MKTQNLLGKGVVSTGYDSTGYETKLVKPDRELAIKWWNKELNGDKRTKLLLANNMISKASSLTGREIEQIWRKEQSLKMVEYINISSKTNFIFKYRINYTCLVIRSIVRS